jgi:hypothetical protein
MLERFDWYFLIKMVNIFVNYFTLLNRFIFDFIVCQIIKMATWIYFNKFYFFDYFHIYFNYSYKNYIDYFYKIYYYTNYLNMTFIFKVNDLYLFLMDIYFMDKWVNVKVNNYFYKLVTITLFHNNFLEENDVLKC